MKEETRSRILVVDDAPENHLLIKVILQGEGYAIDTASSGKEALEKSQQQDYALILLDVQMPEMDGFAVAQILSTSESTKDIPIIFLTGLGPEKKYMMQGYKVGGVEYLNKPIDPDLLKVKAKTFVQLYDQQRQLQSSQEALCEINSSLEEHNQDITDSINYAQNIQKRILPEPAIIEAIFPESFIYYQPRDIVGGDFYWFNINQGHAIMAAVDCTGHGVPGAMLSMVGNNLLNQIIMEQNIIKPNKILDHLNKGLRATFNKQQSNKYITDGMDVGICSFDLHNGSLSFSGANRPLLVSDSSGTSLIKGDLVGIGDSPPAGFGFTNHEIELNQDSCVYLFSDGYPDQFGGADNKKFMLKHFVNLLGSLGDMSMHDQRKTLNTEFMHWKGDARQIDDVMVIGIRPKHDSSRL